jgi:carboxylate-amine ligase
VPDASYLYWDARPSSRHPTVEVRSIDTCLEADDAVAIAGLVRALVWTAIAADRAGRPAPDADARLLDAAMWRASRYGVEGELLSPGQGSAPAAEVVRQLLDHCRAGLQVHGDLELVTAGVGRILERGTGATTQRALVDECPVQAVARLRAVTQGDGPRGQLHVA